MARKNRSGVCIEGLCYLGVMIFIIAGAILREINLLVLLFGLLAGPLLFNRWMVHVMLRRLSVARKPPHAVGAGDSLNVDIQLANRSSGGCWAIVVEDRLQPEREPQEKRTAAAYFPHVPGMETRTVAYCGRLHQRGRYQLGPLFISSRFPLGLIKRTHRLDKFDHLVVYPRLGRLTPQWLQIFSGEQQGLTSAQQQRGVSDGEFHGLRDWQSGDSQRLIHWRTTARQGQLMVRQFQRQRGFDLALVIDPRLTEPDDADRVELAVSFAATVVSDLCRRGGCQLVLSSGNQPDQISFGTASTGLLNEMMEQLAVLQASEEDLGDSLAAALDHVRPGTSVMVISTQGADLADAARYPQLWETPHRQQRMAKTQVLNVAKGDLQRLFYLEEPTANGRTRSNGQPNNRQGGIYVNA